MPKRKISEVNYAQNVIPKDYKCDHCGAKGVKLWREYQTIAEVTDLLCADCAESREKKGHKDGWQSPFRQGNGDQIGWHIPAIPVEGENTYWGYTSVPQDGVDWWNDLPTSKLFSKTKKGGVLMPTDEPRAFVSEIDGKMVLVDPVAVAVGRTIAKYNCRNTLEMQADRVIHFKQRVAELGKTASDVVITLVNVDDVHGRPLANILMPGMNWQEIRDRGETPFSRGLAGREGIQEYLESFDQEAAAKLRDMTDIAVVVVDNGVAEVFPA